MQAMYGDLRAWHHELAIAQAHYCAQPSSSGHKGSDAAQQRRHRQPLRTLRRGAEAENDAAASNADPADAAVCPSSFRPDLSHAEASSASAATDSSQSSPTEVCAAGSAAQEAGPTSNFFATGDSGCLDVTLALQFQVNKGQLSLSESLHKRQLLGFADLVPEGRKSLFVLFKHRETFYELEGALACLCVQGSAPGNVACTAAMTVAPSVLRCYLYVDAQLAW